jgi:hypothetical protein
MQRQDCDHVLRWTDPTSPAIEIALNAGCDRLKVRCNRCGQLSRADLGKVRRPRATLSFGLQYLNAD